MFFRTMDHSQPPVDDPNQTPEVNAQRRREYDTIRRLNETLETVIRNFKQAGENINASISCGSFLAGKKKALAH